MITTGTVKTLSTKYQTTEPNIWREYVQHLFLSYFYQQPQAKDIFFKGGTALRIVYKSPRFSEDLDFGSTLHSVKKIEAVILNTLEEIAREGITSKVIESKETSGGYLAIIDFNLAGQIVRLRIEASFREEKIKGEIEQIANDFILPYLVNLLDKEQLVKGKITALLDRQKPRDFYDLYFLLQNGLVTVEQKKRLQEILPLIKNSRINFSNELKIFLPVSLWPIIKDFRSVLERTIEKSIGGIMR